MLSVRGPCPWAAPTVSFERTVQSFLCGVSAAAFLCQTMPFEAMIEKKTLFGYFFAPRLPVCKVPAVLRLLRSVTTGTWRKKPSPKGLVLASTLPDVADAAFVLCLV